jgi:hypothetical protein
MSYRGVRIIFLSAALTVSIISPEASWFFLAGYAGLLHIQYKMGDTSH